MSFMTVTNHQADHSGDTEEVDVGAYPSQSVPAVIVHTRHTTTADTH